MSCAAQSKPQIQCRTLTLTGELSSGDHFEKPIGAGLILRIDPEKTSGWFISLTPKDKPDKDYIYPVNPPLRFNPVQTLGPGYGEDSKASLTVSHDMRFLLSQQDYEQISPLLTNALWPYKAPNPDAAANEYLADLKRLKTGLLKLSVSAFDLDADTGSIKHITFRAAISAPEGFAFDAALKPKLSACPLPPW
ncbi:MAG: hypothetical protein WA824_16815 [Candidatus Sulfotelmatobacter sp.]